MNWTEQGVTTAKDTVNRYQGAKQLLESKGGSFDAIAWTAGPYDLVAMVTVPDDDTGVAFNLQLAMGGNLRTLTMPAYTADDMTRILDKID
jgi:uncharacterized protein with GYD domain